MLINHKTNTQAESNSTRKLNAAHVTCMYFSFNLIELNAKVSTSSRERVTNIIQVELLGKYVAGDKLQIAKIRGNNAGGITVENVRISKRAARPQHAL
jgi:hypothetical protein